MCENIDLSFQKEFFYLYGSYRSVWSEDILRGKLLLEIRVLYTGCNHKGVQVILFLSDCTSQAVQAS